MVGVSDTDAVFVMMITLVSFIMGVFACRDIDIVIEHFKNVQKEKEKEQWWN